jgi:hypothetical protein
LRVYHNSYNPDEYIAFLGFVDKDILNLVHRVGDFPLEESLLIGLRKPSGGAFLAGYDQFICTPLLLTGS